MRITLGLLVVLVGCGGGARERAYCERLGQLCDSGGMTAQDMTECTGEFVEFKQLFGAEQYDRFLTCGLEATSCMEIAGCMSGVVVNAGEQAVDDLERGFDKMRPGHGRTGLPPECKRADEVCSEDDPFARDKCVEMVGNLKADPDNRAKLVRCYEASKNCIAFAKCTTDLWFELH